MRTIKLNRRNRPDATGFSARMLFSPDSPVATASVSRRATPRQHSARFGFAQLQGHDSARFARWLRVLVLLATVPLTWACDGGPTAPAKMCTYTDTVYKFLYKGDTVVLGPDLTHYLWYTITTTVPADARGNCAPKDSK